MVLAATRNLSDSPVLRAGDEERDLREAVAQLVGRYGRKYFQDAVRDGRPPEELWLELGAAGFLGAHIAEEYGGGGAGFHHTAIVIEECAAHGCPMQYIVISPTICGTLLSYHGSQELKQRWLPGIADGTRKMCFAITEPDAGTNTHKISTTAHRVPGGGWTISGAKYWTSGINEADAVCVVARDADVGPSGRPTLSLFIVDTQAPGLSYQQLPSALDAPEKQFMTFFDDVPVEPENVIGVEGHGLRQVFAGLNPERIAAASLANGIGLYAIKRASEYARERVVWSEPIGAHQGVAHPLAKAYVDVQLARLMTMRAAELLDAGVDAAEAANMAKLAAGDAVLQALDQAIQVHGGNGLSKEIGLADLWFTARMLKTAPVSREMVLNYVAEHSLGLPKSY
jgi:alkylation response protein AidB-like acyl-CoA dehydrogenase